MTGASQSCPSSDQPAPRHNISKPSFNVHVKLAVDRGKVCTAHQSSQQVVPVLSLVPPSVDRSRTLAPITRKGTLGLGSLAGNKEAAGVAQKPATAPKQLIPLTERKESEEGLKSPADRAAFDSSYLVVENKRDLLADYQRVCILGKGAHGKVIKVVSKKNERVYALKVISRDCCNESETLQNEVEVLKKLVRTGRSSFTAGPSEHSPSLRVCPGCQELLSPHRILRWRRVDQEGDGSETLFGECSGTDNEATAIGVGILPRP